MVLKFGWVVFFLMLVALVCGQDVGLVKEVVVQGNSRVSKEAIASSMSLKVGTPYSDAKRDADKQTLGDLGFFSSVDILGEPVDTGWRVTVSVAEYPVIKEIRVSGNTVIGTDQILKLISTNVKQGAVFNARDRDPSSRAIEKLYSDKGFFAQVVNFSPLPDSPGTLDITIIEERVGIVSVQGNKLTKDWVMKRLIKTRSGEVFSASKWTSDLRRLVNTGWFDPVRSLEDYQRQLGVIDLTADIKEQRTGTFNVGVQLDPQSSLAGILKYTQSNLGGTGQTIGIDFLQATTGGGPSVSLDYTNPFIDDQDTTLRASVYSRLVYRFANNLFGGGGVSFTNNSPYDERHTGFSVGVSRPFTNSVSAGVSARLERVDTENLNNLVDNYQTPNDPTDDQMTNNYIKQDGTVGVLTFGGTRNRRDVDIDPSRGDYMGLTIEPGVADITSVGGLTTTTNVLGTHTFVRATADYRVYWSPDKRRTASDLTAPKRVIAFRARYGTVEGTVPFFEQYFAGGSDTVRGYPDDRFWGKQEAIMNLELRYPIQKTFSLIGFVDYGGAWGGYGTIQSYDQSNNFKLHLGYGPGVSFHTPLGNIQLFLGFNEQGGTQTHFLIGSSF